MENDSLKLELAAFMIATNLVAFSLGMLIVVVDFQVLRFLTELEPYHLLPVAIGLVLFSIWSYHLLGELRDKLG